MLACTAWYMTRRLIKLTPKGVVFVFLFLCLHAVVPLATCGISTVLGFGIKA